MDRHYIGIGATSKVNPLPECEKDIRVVAKFFADNSFVSDAIIEQVVEFQHVLDVSKTANGSSNVVIHYSGHGTVKDGDFALWFGDENHIVKWSDIVSELIEPLSKTCKNITVLLDTCFSGSALMTAPDNQADPEFRKKIKSINTTANVPALEIGDVQSSKRILNLAIVTACGRKEVADGKWILLTNNGWSTYSTDGMSLFSFALAEQLMLAKHLEWVARANWDYRKVKDRARTVSQVQDGIQAMVRGVYTHFGSPLYQGLPPRTDGPQTQIRIGRSHDGFLFDYNGA